MITKSENDIYFERLQERYFKILVYIYETIVKQANDKEYSKMWGAFGIALNNYLFFNPYTKEVTETFKHSYKMGFSIDSVLNQIPALREKHLHLMEEEKIKNTTIHPHYKNTFRRILKMPSLVAQVSHPGGYIFNSDFINEQNDKKIIKVLIKYFAIQRFFHQYLQIDFDKVNINDFDKLFPNKQIDSNLTNESIIIKTEIDSISGMLSKKIYFSYAWNDNQSSIDREEIVNKLYKTLLDKKFTVRRDRMDLEYCGLISEFMNEIGKGSIIIVAISNKYLKSLYCMFELYEIYRNSKLEKRGFIEKIFPIHVEFINLNDPIILDKYFEYWEDKEKEWYSFFQKRMEKAGKTQFVKYNEVKKVRKEFGDLASFIMDINALTPALLLENNFEQILLEIENKINKNE